MEGQDRDMKTYSKLGRRTVKNDRAKKTKIFLYKSFSNYILTPILLLFPRCLDTKKMTERSLFHLIPIVIKRLECRQRNVIYFHKYICTQMKC